MKQVETDQKYLPPEDRAGQGGVAAMLRAEAADSSAGGVPYISLTDEQAAAGWGWDAVRKMRDENNARGDYQPCVYAVQDGGWPVRLLLGDSGWAQQNNDGATYHFHVQPQTDHGVVLVGFRKATDIPDNFDWEFAPIVLMLRFNSSDDLKGFVVSYVKPAAPKSIEDCPASADQRRPDPGVTVRKGASCGPTELQPPWVEQGGIVELWISGSCARFKISRVVQEDLICGFGDWKIWEEVGYRASSNWAEMKNAGTFPTHTQAFEHLILNGYGLPLGALDPLPGSDLYSAPGGRG